MITRDAAYWRQYRKDHPGIYMKYHAKIIDKKRIQLKAWSEKNRDKRHATAKKYYDSHKDIVNQRNKQYHEANKDSIHNQAKGYALKNKEVIKVKMAAYHKKRYATDPKYKAGLFHRATERRITVQQRTTNPKPILDFIESVKSKPSAICYYCQKRVSTNHIHFDHMIPLSKGGMHSVENLCVSCDKCNLSKHDKLIADWMTLGQQLLTL